MCNFLIENIFERIITKPVSIEYDDAPSSEYVTLQLSYNISDVNLNLRPNYKVIFKNIETTIDCLSNMNITIDENRCVFTIIGQYVKERFFNLVIEECLERSIPETMDEMDESTIVADIHAFNNLLIEKMFIGDTEEDAALIKYSERIDSLFQSRFCSNILDKSVEIMHRDLHDMVVVAENSSTKMDDASLFPNCMVSKSTIDLIGLIERILKQLENVKPDIALRLLSTISTILDRYVSEVPTYHAKLLMNIPQQTALFHNNCMYLAYWIKKLADLKDCHEIGHSIHVQGIEFLNKQISNQKQQILDILREFDLNVSSSELGKLKF